MRLHSSAIADKSSPLLQQKSPRQGLLWGFIGVATFSLTVPLTRIAVVDGGLGALFVGSGRAVVAGVLAILALGMTRQRLPRAKQWLRLTVVAGGIVIGFPMLTSYALTVSTASHGAVVIATLPAATAVVAVLRIGERPGAVFWTATVGGSIAAVVFAAVHSGGASSLNWSDLLFVTAVIAAACGYAEGGLLARELGAWQTISWSLVLSLPVMMTLASISAINAPPTGTGAQWAAFVYLGVMSMFLGFFAWYRGLGIGPVSRVSQVQLLQPVMSLAWAALLIGESVTLVTVIGAGVVILCAGVAVNSRLVKVSADRTKPGKPAEVPSTSAQRT
ncbi:DMT family transporter [Nesterenkonia haasae]|uniref:DMT family transporter n=1 Tax=Nesterenkonia haasae TaxID=2587813 RepID=UPI001390A36E|nr:DMT family transporter [Nesterenkonia haasae]NDK32627.1 DMT family transporter [Nesterenkonia haasae]